METVRYRRLVPYLLCQWRGLLAILVLTGFTSVAAALQPWPLKILVDHALGHAPLPGWLGSAIERLGASPSVPLLLFLAALGSLAVFALANALDAGLTWAWTVTGQRMVYSLAADLFHHLQRLSLLFHARRSTGDLLNRLTSDTWCVYSLTDGLLTPAYHIMQFLTVGTVAWMLDRRLAGLSIAMAPMLAFSSFYFGGKLKRRARLSREAQSRLVSFVHQTLSAMPLVQAFSTERANQERFQNLADDAVGLSQRGALLTSAYGLVNGFVLTLGAAAVLYAGGRRVLSGSLSLGALIVFIAYIRNMQSAAEGLLGTYSALKPVEAGMDRVLELLNAGERIVDRPAAIDVPMRPLEGASVRFESVTFGYQPGEPVLRRVNLQARPGEKIALVGPTGAGKTTLVSMIPRFFDPWEGRITLDGVDLRDLRLRSLRAQVSLVLQESFLFPSSVADNIAYGRPGGTRDEVIAAAVAANADEFIRRLPQGYDTVLGERGATLSGGERQRISIARALLKNAPILILDEPTSALDAETESALLEALERLMKGRTVFIIAHRLSTVQRVDHVVVLDAGTVVEAGGRSELLACDGHFQRMHTLQSEGVAWR